MDTRRSRPPARMTSRGSFRAGSPLPTLRSTLRNSGALRRHSTTQHYQTFPTQPPKTAGHRGRGSNSSSSTSLATDEHHHATPLKIGQLALLALLSLAEQTALNSISPYLPAMVASFPGIDSEKVGVYVGLLASAFALAQLTTNLIWGYLSDIIGRKPVMLLGTSLLCGCFVLFGFCTRYWHIVLVHVAMGLLNGNAAVVPTCLGELTDRSNQSKAFTWLPVVYSLGSITGPALGGLLVGTLAGDQYPFLAPNILGSSLLAVSVIVLFIWFDETLEERGEAFDWREHLGWLCCCMRRTQNKLKHTLNSSSPEARNGRSNTLLEEDETDEERGLLGPDDEDEGGDAKEPSDSATWRQLFNRTTLLLLTTYLVFQVSNISFSSLYPLFAAGPPPTGRGLHADVIGVSLSVAGIFTILFQLFLFRPIKARLGNLGTYRVSLLGFAISMALMPWVGYRESEPPFGFGDSKVWLYVEMGFILVIKNICAVGGLSSVMLLITNSAPSHASLGTLQGVAQTLSAAGRSFGPFVSGSLFSLSVHVQPKGEALAWGLFGGIALAGWLGTYAIHSEGLESTDDGFEEDEQHSDDEQA
ncbi:putative Major facilitator superfamily (MFS) profile domain-containing protein [Seiridium cardinale]|uniref:Major facilitator superfamily (MFS) profile domain-containing protein n=1 Tax=Seiridium cardinale TaxID=138064 RepID=A0ABR2XNJ6_9PEZI